MKKLKTYFVQTGCVINNEHFLPYAAGIIAAYSFSIEKIKSVFELSDIIYKCDDFVTTVNCITEPAVVAFSNYMWNFKFNLKLAKEIKKRFPDCVIIFGGHQISDTQDWLNKYSFIDFAIYGEGEIIFSKILLALCGNGNFSDIPNISYRSGCKIFKTEKCSICEDINKFPSPYISGIFDKIIKNNDDTFAAVIETSRGCPYHCAYCDWGDYDIPLRHFHIDRVKKEIEWLGKNSIVFVVLADSNFGICESDEKIVEDFIQAKKNYGYPKAVEIAFAKNNPTHVFSMNKKLYENNMSRGATLSMQSLSIHALENIGRENISCDKFMELIRLYSENNIPAYTELILGLPGETYESFCEGIEYLLDNGQHNSIHVFFCEILPNAIMGNDEYIKKHGIEFLRRDFSLRNGIHSEGIQGESKIIVATKNMSRTMFLKAMLYAFIIQTFHNFGLCRIFALYFHYEKKMKYYEFYSLLMDWLINNSQSYTGQIFNNFFERYKMSVNGENADVYENTAFGETKFNLSDGAFLELISLGDTFYKEMSIFLSSLCNESEFVDELVRFQSIIIRKPSNSEFYEFFSYNWIDYYNGIIKGKRVPLKKEKIKMHVLPSLEYNDLISYSKEVAIKGRRIGKSIVLNDKNSYTIKHIK